MPRIEKVKLRLKDSRKDEREFEKAHALRILRLKNSQYVLPSNSPFEFVNNELRRKPSKKSDKE